ncbi:MAG: hypothetical protein E2581_20910 [Pseudomonas sp.]|uniref:DUF6950 family protein n=1 Tax=unclassified Pseudomonas TaxID=196821 RepID=UPI001D3F265F|nr:MULTISPECIES: hypothetical protein [unclassified Pseudomonas]MPT00937.1 hypothetical protein [Pseudomonas sp.]WBM34155.1 hypothetical protein M2J80_06770 [Pseudomonas sp. NY11382]
MRYRDWPARLHETIQAASERPFLWGEFDCCLFVSDCSIAICGVDPAKEYRGRYKTEIGAKRVIAARHGSLEAVLDVHFMRVPVEFVQRGDIVAFENEQGKCVAVYWSDRYWAATDIGAASVDCNPLAAWRVE